MDEQSTYSVFAGDRLIVAANLKTMLRKTKAYLDADTEAAVLIFEDRTGKQVDFDFRGTADEVLGRVAGVPARPGPGRPRLGVISREVSLLPRHWDWLEQQPQGISAALRRLVDEARKREPEKERRRLARDAAGKFMWAMAGDRPGFEEASRALYAQDADRLGTLIRDWPEDVRRTIERILQGVEVADEPIR